MQPHPNSKKLISKSINTILNEKANGHLIESFETLDKYFKQPRPLMLMYAVAGFGKSIYAINYIREGYKVIFGCKSNQQVIEQYNNFVQLEGVSAQKILSRKFLLEQTGIKSVLDKKLHPWDPGKLNEQQTKKTAIKSGMDESEFNRIWKNADPELPNYNHDIIFTTHAKIQTWAAIQDFIPINTIIIFDDIEFSDISPYKPYQEFFEGSKINNEPVEVAIIGKEKYFKKPENAIYGKGLKKCHILFTTDGNNSANIIMQQHPTIHAPDLKVTETISGGKIHLLQTRLVGQKYDGVLFPLIERLKRDAGEEIIYIADGTKSYNNHTTISGSNSLADNHTIIKISQPTGRELFLLADLLDITDMHELKTRIMVDKFETAVGRSRGLRWNGNQETVCIVLIDQQFAKSVARETRYATEPIINCDHDNYEQRNTENIVENCHWLLSYAEYYVAKGLKAPNNQFINDAKKAIKNAKNQGLTLERILNSVKTLKEQNSETWQPKFDKTLQKLKNYKLE